MPVIFRRHLATSMLALLLAAPAGAQESPPPPRAGTDAEVERSKKRDRELRERDFRPSEEISQDASVAFPVDI